MRPRTQTEGHANRARVAFVVIVLVAAAGLSIVIAGVAPFSSATFATFAQAEARAAVIPPEILGGPWTLSTVRGLDLQYEVPESDWAGANCSVIAGGLAVPALGATIDGYNGNFSQGALPIWFFGYLGGAENHSFSRELLVLVDRGQAYMVGEIVLSQWCGFFSFPEAISGPIVGSNVVAQEFSALDPTRVFGGSFAAATLVFQILQSTPSPLWLVLVTNCVSISGGAAGTGSWLQAEYSTTTGGFAGDFGYASTACSSVISYPVYWT